MRWQQGRRSRNVVDQRRGRASAGRGSPARRGGSKVGGLMTMGIVVAGLIFGFNPMKLLNLTGGGGLGGASSGCLLYTSPSPRDQRGSRMPSSA